MNTLWISTFVIRILLFRFGEYYVCKPCELSKYEGKKAIETPADLIVAGKY